MFKSCKRNTDIKIWNNFVPNKNTLKSKGSIDKFSVSSSRTEMMSLSSEVSMDIFIRFIYIKKGLGTLPFDNLYINRPILCLTNILNGRIPERAYNCLYLYIYVKE